MLCFDDCTKWPHMWHITINSCDIKHTCSFYFFKQFAHITLLYFNFKIPVSSDTIYFFQICPIGIYYILASKQPSPELLQSTQSDSQSLQKQMMKKNWLKQKEKAVSKRQIPRKLSVSEQENFQNRAKPAKKAWL